MWELVKNIVKACAEWGGFLNKRQELANSPEKQAAAKGKTDAEVADDAAKAVAKDDDEAIRKALAE